MRGSVLSLLKQIRGSYEVPGKNSHRWCRYFSSPSNFKAEGGLFGHSQLTSSSAWADVASEAIARCDGLVAEVHTCKPGRKLLHLVDEISDVICHATDSANFCQVVHADSEWQMAACRSAIQLNSYVAKLNTDLALFTGLQATMVAAGNLTSKEALQQGWTHEEVTVGNSLLHEFQQSGMGFSGDTQSRYRDLVGQEDKLKTEIQSFEMSGSAEMLVALSEKAVTSLQMSRTKRPPTFSRASNTSLATVALKKGQAYNMLNQLKCTHDREVVYKAMFSLPDSVLSRIVELADVRKDIASLVSADSYSEYKLHGTSLANSIDAVSFFLKQRKAAADRRAQSDVQMLDKWTRQNGLLDDEEFGVWDFSIGAAGCLPAAVERHSRQRFTVKGALTALFEVVESLFGVSFQQMPLSSSETWATGVQKFAAIHQTRGHLGIVYLDLLSRPGKYGGSAHYTLQCGRRQSDGSYQTPIVALACSFMHSRNASLSFAMVQTMFHEFGHALNSMLCDNELQHMFGARGPLDTVEIPSHILERFCIHPHVLDLLLDYSGISNKAAREASIKDILFLDDYISGIRRQQDLVMPMFDGVLHGASPPTSVDDLKRVTTGVLNDALPYHMPHGSFERISLNHVVGYGSLCHAYPYADDVAEAVWNVKFEGDPLNSDAGGHVSEVLFRPGGAVDAVNAINSIVPGLMQPHGGGFYPKVS